MKIISLIGGMMLMIVLLFYGYSFSQTEKTQDEKSIEERLTQIEQTLTCRNQNE